jgi:hypothetical protein
MFGPLSEDNSDLQDIKGPQVGASAAGYYNLKSLRFADDVKAAEIDISAKKMNDKLSSPSASSSSTAKGAQTPARSDDPFLLIRRHPPSHIFSNESFEVEVGLEIPRPASPASQPADGDIQLVATLHNLKSGHACGAAEATLTVDPPYLSIGSLGSPSKRLGRIRCTLQLNSALKEKGAAFAIHLTPRQDINQPIKGITTVSTGAIHIVNYKTKLSMEEEWGPVWFKDEGGRDKCMEVFAGVYGKDEQLVTGDSIPLQVTLYYNGEHGEPVKVSNQEILRSLGSGKIQTDKATGKARVRFRIEDVSKNHQGQDFKVQIGPDPKAKAYKDVAPGYTPTVSVRSKRNKRARHGSSSIRGPSLERRQSPPPRSRNVYADEPHAQRDIFMETTDLVRLREAMKGVINWTDEVVNGLFPLQWQVLGYAQNPDGSPDYSRPYHNMPSPNACISRVLSMYSDTTREDLRILLTAVEQAIPSRPDESYASIPPSLPREPEDHYGLLRVPPPGALTLPGIGRRPGIHPLLASEAYRDKPDSTPIHYQAPPGMLQRHQPHMPFLRPREPPQNITVEEADPMHMRATAGLPQMRSPMGENVSTIPVQRSALHGYHGEQERESRESEVEYVLAKQYKALRTGERLGFPAYSANREILGFYRESVSKVGVGQFTPISRHRNDFGPLEIMQATEILEDAIEKKSEAVHYLKNWGSISNLIDHALVYDWSKDIANEEAPGAS